MGPTTIWEGLNSVILSAKQTFSYENMGLGSYCVFYGDWLLALVLGLPIALQVVSLALKSAKISRLLY